MNYDLRAVIDEEFYKDVPHPKATTVGDLISILQRLPNGLPVRSSFEDEVAVVVYNISGAVGTPHVQIVEPEY